MRYVLAGLTTVLATAPAVAADLRSFADATLHAVQFIDRDEGWAVGDDGVVWHTIDSGATWERQPTGVRASLRGICFLTPYTGWIVGREERPHGGGSVGVVLTTTDGGLKWTRTSVTDTLPGLHCVRFFDDRHGLVAGDGTDRFPTGAFTTEDGGKSWKPLAGPRCPGWLAADFSDLRTGSLAGSWSRLATLRNGLFSPADVDTLGGRSVRGLKLNGSRAVAVGQGGMVLTSADSAGVRWGFADLKLSPEALAGWDFHAVAVLDKQIWVAGRPGSAVLHSPDHGRSWEVQPTGQSLPLNGVCFIDDLRGWAVGELGTILGTADAGKTWKVQRRGGQRAAVLMIHATASGVPLDAVAQLGGEEGYLIHALRVIAPDPESAAPKQATEAQRLAAAMRQVGGATGEVLWQFPVPQHQEVQAPGDLVAGWDKLHSQKAAEQLLRQLVLAIRTWRPEVIVTDAASGTAEGQLIAEAVKAAFDQAAEAGAYPEQLTTQKLEPWAAKKLYALTSGTGPVVMDTAEPRAFLRDAPRDLAAPAAGLFADNAVELPGRRAFRLLAGRLPGAERHTDLMQGIDLAAGGTARRERPALTKENADKVAELQKALRQRRNLQAFLKPDFKSLGEPEQFLAQIRPALDALPEAQAAPAAFAMANTYVRAGQWPLAREIFLMLVDRYPAHPLALDSYRWLVRYHSSSEARRREELGHFIITSRFEVLSAPKAEPNQPPVQQVVQRQLLLLQDSTTARKWYAGSLEMEPRLAAFGAMHANDPGIQFCLQAARRRLGDFETPKKYLTRFLADTAASPGDPVAMVAGDPWREAAAAELWLTNRTGTCPRPLTGCKQTPMRPFLDGVLDDECWQSAQTMKLRDAVGATAKANPTEAFLTYDAEYLYLAVKCQHPGGEAVPPAKGRKHDADLRGHDRVCLLLDLDRDFQTCYRIEFDERGCVAEDCWGDVSWNPRLFVAVKSDANGWMAEVAIPLKEMTGDSVSLGNTWAVNVTRTLPGRGVQGWSLPADTKPRPEGMGFVVFMQEEKK